MSISTKDYDELLEHIAIDDDGAIWWGNGHRLRGKKAGALCGGGYLQIGFRYKYYYAHRVVFYNRYGYLPKFIDHADGNPSNNHINNLRPCTHSQNMQNSKMQKNNTSNVIGVYWHKAAKKWAAQIMLEGKNMHLGSFKGKDDAIKARRDAERKYHGDFASST